MRDLDAIWLLIVIAATFALHEAAHGLAGQAMGYKTYVRVNSSGLTEGQKATPAHEQIMTAAGPAVTIGQGAVGLILAVAFGWRGAFAIVFSALMMCSLAAVASLRTPNDEARLGLAWDMGFWTVHTLVIAILLVMTLIAWRRLNLSLRYVATAFPIACFGMGAAVVAEPYLPTLHL